MTAILVTCGVLVGILTGWCAASVTYRVRIADIIAARPEVMARHMDRVVNLEALEHKQTMARLRMQMSGRRTVRYDGGIPAKVTKMRARRRITINRDDRA